MQTVSLKKSLFISAVGFALGLGFLIPLQKILTDGTSVADESPPDLLAPYEDARNILNLWPYSVNDHTELGKFHNGIDFIAKDDLTPFYAIADGTVDTVEIFKNERNGMEQVNLYIVVNSHYGYGMGFEMFGNERNLGEQQMQNIYVKKGQRVKQGDLIGLLLKRGDGAHVHISLKRDGEDICFFPLFSEDVQAELEPKLMGTLDGKRVACYE